MVFHNFAKKKKHLGEWHFFKQRINRQSKHATHNIRLFIAGYFVRYKQNKTFLNNFIK